MDAGTAGTCAVPAPRLVGLVEGSAPTRALGRSASRAWARRGLNVDEGRGDGSTSRALVLVERAGLPWLVDEGR